MKERKADHLDIQKPKPVSPQIPEPRLPKNDFGELYIVATPIGNLEDITLRALRILKGVDLIAAESRQHSKVLCGHYGIKTRLISYNQNNQKVKGPEIIRLLRSGRDVALISNAGTPGISDPGSVLINQAVEQNIRVSPIPGPSVVTTALSVSGFRSDHFIFLGFLSSKAGKRRKELRDLLSESLSMILFESPHRIRATLSDIKEIMGDRMVVLLREMTKIYEEITRGPINAVLESLEPNKIRGEFTLVLAGGAKNGNEDLLNPRVQKRIQGLLKEGNGPLKGIAKEISFEEGLNYKRVYRECLLIKRVLEKRHKNG